MFYYQVENAEIAARAAKAAYLQRFGWMMTCSTPGSHWLWQRDFAQEDRRKRRRWQRRKPGPYGKGSAPTPYGRITADLDLAVRMTVAELDPQSELAGDDD